MAKFCRRSLLLAEGRGTRSCERNNERREGEEEGRQWKTEKEGSETVTSEGSVNGLDLAALSARLSQQLEELSRMSSSPSPSPSSSPLPPIAPTRPARRSCGRVDTPTTSPLSTPPTRQRRRVSDSSVVMRVEPGRACRGRGASLAGITSNRDGNTHDIGYIRMLTVVGAYYQSIYEDLSAKNLKSKALTMSRQGV